MPDANSKIGTPGQPGQDTPVVVWDTWREKREQFVIRESGGAFSYVAPEPFKNGQPPSTTGPNPQIVMCTGAAPPPAGHITALQTNKVENYLDEVDEIGLAILSAGTDTTQFDEDTLARYQVKFNYNHYEDIRGKLWWNPPTLTAAISAETSGGNGAGVVLASGSNSSTTTGSILTKSAWKLLSSAEVNSGAYCMQSSTFYETENDEPCFNYGTFGLIGLHIIRKTDNFPYLFFSTFEHNGNYPGAFTYANTNAAGTSSGTFAASQVNPFGIAYQNPPNPAPNPNSITTPGSPSNQASSAVSGGATLETSNDPKTLALPHQCTQRHKWSLAVLLRLPRQISTRAALFRRCLDAVQSRAALHHCLGSNMRETRQARQNQRHV